MILFSKKQSNMPRRRLANSVVPESNSSDLFKRNRTLTGTTPTPESPRIHVHHLSIRRRKLFGILLTTIITIVLLWVLISHFTATVSVSTSNTAISKPIETSKYEQAIQDYLSNNYLGRLQFLLDQPNLSTYVSSKLPEVESVVQKTMTGIGITNFSITMRVPVAGWKINGEQYYVDANGAAFEQNYFAAPSVQIIDNSGASLKAGEASVSRRFLGFVGQVVSLAKSSGYPVAQAILPVNTTRELEIKLKDINLLVKMSIDRPAGEQVEDMSRAVNYITSHSLAPSYVDVRVSGKAVYL